MPMFNKKFKKLEEKLKELGNGKVVNYYSESKESVDGVKSFYNDKYHILGPTFIDEEKRYVLTFVYDKKKVIVSEDYPNA